MKHIVLLGASNALMPFRLREGLASNENVKLINLSLGATGSLSKVYEIYREKNQEILKKADLVIIETNIIDVTNYDAKFTSPQTAIRNISWLYESLYALQTRVLTLICARRVGKNHFIHNAHIKYCNLYGFNVIDMNAYYVDKDLFPFWWDSIREAHHQPRVTMYNLGANIANNLDNFAYPKEKLPKSTLEFKVLNPKDMLCKGGEPEIIHKKDLFSNEIIFLLKDEVKLKFPKEFLGYTLVGLHTYTPSKNIKTEHQGLTTYSSCVLENKNLTIVKASWSNRFFLNIEQEFIIDEESFIAYNQQNLALTEHWSEKPMHNTLDSFGLIEILCIKNLPERIEIPSDKVYIKPENDFSHLIPLVEFYKEIIKEYNAFLLKPELFPNLNALMQNKLASLQNQIKFGTATQRIHNHLAYKLGQIIIRNSKSLFGLFKLPYLLIALALIHKEQEKAYKEKIKANPKLALPPLESYLDYQEALKEKECFTYKLGSAFIKGCKSWYKGGMIKFYFEAKKLEREFKRSLNN